MVASSAAAVITITGTNAVPPFSLTCALAPAATGGYAAASPVPARCQAMITGTAAAGDTLITTVNEAAVTYVAGPSETAASLAAHIAARVSADVQVDLLTRLPVSGIVQATSSGNVITFTPVDPASAFTLVCSVGAGHRVVHPGQLDPGDRHGDHHRAPSRRARR